MTGGQRRQRAVKKSAQTGVKNHLKNEQLIHQARAEVLKTTVDEQMTVGEGTATWVREIMLQCERIIVSDICSGLQTCCSVSGVRTLRVVRVVLLGVQ
jgi:hypothetical protein